MIRNHIRRSIWLIEENKITIIEILFGFLTFYEKKKCDLKNQNLSGAARGGHVFADDIPSFFLGSRQFSWGMIESTSTLHLAGCKFESLAYKYYNWH